MLIETKRKLTKEGKSKISKKATKKIKTIKKILVPLDGSKNSFHALDMAISQALHYHASITGVYILDLPVTLEYSALDPVGLHLHKQAEKFMNLAKSRATKKQVSFKSLIKSGKTGPEIVNMARKDKFDLVVIGKRGIGSVTEIFLGSVSHYVIHHSEIPILIVK